eukprot:9177260-Pyramimonas_sp.AAC.1
MRCIDYFVVSRQIAGQARAEVVQNVPISPHLPVRLVLPSVEPLCSVRFVQVPKRFPTELPIGCLGPPPEVDPWDHVGELCSDPDLLIQDKWDAFLRAAEGQRLHLFQISGGQCDEYVGRGRPLQVKWKTPPAPNPP